MKYLFLLFILSTFLIFCKKGPSIPDLKPSNYPKRHTACFGHIEHNMYGVRISGSGTVLWQNDYGGSIHDGGEDGKQSGDGGYILAGRSYSFDNYFEQMYLVKTYESGNTEWQKDIGRAGMMQHIISMKLTMPVF